MGNGILYVVGVVLGLGLAWYFLWPYIKKSENKMKSGVRDFQIKQIKKNIEEMQITKEDLFDE